MRGFLAGLLIGATFPVVVCAGCSAGQLNARPSRCYEATGHTVSGDFLHAFDAWGGQRSLGYPITETFEQSGRRVQFFTYARLEDHPDNPGGRVVKLSMLGEQLGRRRPPIDVRRAPAGLDRTARYYPESGHAVSGDFLRFLAANGGTERFGYPIAEPIISGGRLVQDFQRVRLVWEPGATPTVRMEESGRVMFDAQMADRALLAPVACPPDAETVPSGGSSADAVRETRRHGIMAW